MVKRGLARAADLFLVAMASVILFLPFLLESLRAIKYMRIRRRYGDPWRPIWAGDPARKVGGD